MARRIKASITYPSVLFCILLAVVAVLLIWVLPVFDSVYAQLGTSLTGVAAVLLGVGKALKFALPVFAAVIAVLLAIAALPPARRIAVSGWKAVFGDRGAAGMINSARFVSVVSLALGSGMTDGEAISLACTLAECESKMFSARANACLRRSDEGASLTEALSGEGFLLERDRRLYDAGVRSGRGDEVLAGIADSMLERGEEALEAEVGKLEPAMVAVACIMIGAVLLSVMLPLLNIMNTIG